MIYILTGRRELGKTTLADKMASDPMFTKTVIFDPRFQWPDADPVGTLPDDGGELWRRLIDPAITRIVVQPPDALQDTADELARMLRDAVSLQPDLRLAVLIDESHLVDDFSAWEWLARCAGRKKVHLIFTTHRPQDFTTTIRSLLDYWLLFQTTQEHDINVVRKRTTEDVAIAVQTLPPFHFIEWDDNRRTATLHANPGAWFHPIQSGALQKAG